MPTLLPHRSNPGFFAKVPLGILPRLAAVLVFLLPLAAHGAHSLNLEAKDLYGAKQSLAALRGKVVVLSFWATWCAPCQEELSRLSQLSSRYTGRDVEFVAVSIDEAKDRPKIRAFLAKRGIALQVWTGPTAECLDHFGLGNIVPGTVVLDRQGQPVTRIMGEARDEDVQTAVDWLLGGGKGDAPKALVKRY